MSLTAVGVGIVVGGASGIICFLFTKDLNLSIAVSMIISEVSYQGNRERRR